MEDPFFYLGTHLGLAFNFPAFNFPYLPLPCVASPTFPVPLHMGVESTVW